MVIKHKIFPAHESLSCLSCCFVSHLVHVDNQTLKNKDLSDKDKHKDGCTFSSYPYSPQSSAPKASYYYENCHESIVRINPLGGF